MTKHIETRAKLKDIAKISTLVELLDNCNLTDEDREIIKLHYINHKELDFIADALGYSLSAIKKKHKRILTKIDKML